MRLRVSTDTDWRHLLTPYKEHLTATFGPRVIEAMIRDVRTVHLNDDARELTRVFAEGAIGLVVDDESNLEGIITQMDLVDYLTQSVDSPA